MTGYAESRKLRTLLTGTLAILFLSVAVAQTTEQALRQEEEQDYYQKWLEEDVVYIISPEERSVFESLTTAAEKDKFIEQFWHRRDPEPRTPTNEFKEEHYRRIAYANENFKSGIAGWKTDRGRVYIIYGPPDQKETYPTGGNYERRPHEGGGFTQVYPFERWWYRHMEGVGSDIELEFVDPQFSNEYYLAVNPEEKDAVLHSPGLGPTWAEDFGLRSKADRPYFVSNYGEEYPWINNRAKDNPFRRYETYFQVQQPAPIKFNDLKEIVEVDLSYDSLPIQIRHDYFKLNEDQVIVPVTLQFRDRDLTFKEENGKHTARIGIYGVITSLANRIVTEFDDEVSLTYGPDELHRRLTESSLYQKLLSVDGTTRYKLDLVAKDLNSGDVGVVRKAIIPPNFGQDQLTISPPILSGFIQELPDAPPVDKMFVLGDIWIRPQVDKTFRVNDPLGIYLQVYDGAIDQTTNQPSLEITYRVLKDGEMLVENSDDSGNSIHYFSEQRIVLIHALYLNNFTPGEYSLEIVVRDRITDQEVSTSDTFTVKESQQQLTARTRP